MRTLNVFLDRPKLGQNIEAEKESNADFERSVLIGEVSTILISGITRHPSSTPLTYEATRTT